ncbi:trypsin-like peptidase domain-containing protein [Nocardioides sp. C4-1]|uniref:S1C family serine protease n=1 Tax=Nocardioides sp. C4-1 TaxID=3151851 RepID=UPI0032640BB5
MNDQQPDRQPDEGVAPGPPPPPPGHQPADPLNDPWGEQQSQHAPEQPSQQEAQQADPQDDALTQPLSGLPTGAPETASDPLFAPVSRPLPPAPSKPWSDYAGHTTPMPAGPPPERSSSPSYGLGAGAPVDYTASTSRQRRITLARWTWPAIAFLALVVGLIGGVTGSVVYKQATDQAAPPYRGLEDDEIVELPPVEDGGVAAVAETMLPSTVQILASLGGQADGATGSGFVLDEDGHIITNNHVVAGAADGGTVRVVDHEGNTHSVTIVGRSPVYDLAVLQLPDDVDLEPAALGASRFLRVGDGVVAIGSPLGLSATVTSGIVSALNRPVSTGRQSDETSYINAVQTDAAINPGNSGGPLVNLRGQVVGVNSAIATSGGATNGEAGNIGVGFAIPVEQVRITADQILKTGEARYPVIGAQVGGAESSTVEGARLQEVNPDTPAEEAGLESGDVVTQVDGMRVVDGISLIVTIRTHQPGEEIEFTYVRDGQERTATVVLDSEVG